MSEPPKVLIPQETLAILVKLAYYGGIEIQKSSNYQAWEASHSPGAVEAARAKLGLLQRWVESQPEDSNLVLSLGTPDELTQLRNWKAQQLRVESEWEPQKIAKLINAPLGKPIRPAIQKWIEEHVDQH